MFNFVPFAGSRREMTDTETQAGSVRHFLQSNFPQPRSATVAAAAVGGDHQATGAWEACCPHFLPPTPNAGSRELGGVMIDTDADPALIVGDVVHTIRDGLSQPRV